MKITISSPQKSTDVTQLVPSLRWSGDYQQAARTLSLSVLSSPTDKSIPVVDCPLGSNVQLFDQGKTLFDGFVMSRTKNTDASVIELTCFDRGFYLKRNKGYYKFTETPAETIAAQLAGEFGMETGVIAATGVPLTRIFAGVSLYDILATAYTLASRSTGKLYHIGFEGAKLCVREKGPTASTLVIRGGSNLIAASTTESVEQMVNAVKVYDANGNFVRQLEDAETIGLYGRMQELVRQTAKDDKSAEAQKLLDNGGMKQKITVDCLGDLRNRTGGCVVVQEPYTGLYGLFYIDGDTHEWKRGKYYNKLILNYQDIMDEKDAGSLPEG